LRHVSYMHLNTWARFKWSFYPLKM
jgi:hypothetical protein